MLSPIYPPLLAVVAGAESKVRTEPRVEETIQSDRASEIANNGSESILVGTPYLSLCPCHVFSKYRFPLSLSFPKAGRQTSIRNIHSNATQWFPLLLFTAPQLIQGAAGSKAEEAE